MTASTGRSDIARTARGAVGIAGIGFSNAYKLIEDDDHRYARSLDADRRLPASLFISERDGVRNGSVMPLSERCIEDFVATRRSKDDQSTSALAPPSSYESEPTSASTPVNTVG